MSWILSWIGRKTPPPLEGQQWYHVWGVGWKKRGNIIGEHLFWQSFLWVLKLSNDRTVNLLYRTKEIDTTNPLKKKRDVVTEIFTRKVCNSGFTSYKQKKVSWPHSFTDRTVSTQITFPNRQTEVAVVSVCHGNNFSVLTSKICTGSLSSVVSRHPRSKHGMSWHYVLTIWGTVYSTDFSGDYSFESVPPF